MKVEMEFKSGGVLAVSVSAMGQSKTTNGTWKVVKSTANEATIAVKMDGDPTEREATIKFIDGNTIETTPLGGAQPAGMNMGPATFKRAKA